MLLLLRQELDSLGLSTLRVDLEVQVVQVRAQLVGQLLQLLRLQIGDDGQQPVDIHEVFQVLETAVFPYEKFGLHQPELPNASHLKGPE